MSGNFSILHSLYTQLIRSWRFLKVIFLRARFWSFWNVVIVSLFFWPHNCVPYCKCDSNSEWYAVFSIWKFAFIRSLLSMPIARLSLIFICATCLFQSRCSSIKTPRYWTEWVGTSLLLSNLNLKLWSIFSFLGLQITSFFFAFVCLLGFFCFTFQWHLNNSLEYFRESVSCFGINHFRYMCYFYTPWKKSGYSWFCDVFSGCGTKIWPEIG